MARAWRIEYEGALYHVLSGGNERCNIVVDDKDRNLFLDTVGEMSQRFEVDICAYVLMDNHYHLLFRTRRAICLKACNGWEPLTRNDSTYAIFEAAIFFKAALKTCLYKMMLIYCSFHIIFIAIRSAPGW